LSVRIVLYRVSTAEDISDLANLAQQIQPSKSVDLYKITEDLGIIFMNTTEPFDNTDALPYKALFGNHVNVAAGLKTIGGFLPTSEVSKICDWIKTNTIDHFEGFSKMYDSLSEEAKQQLVEIGADDKKALFEGYVNPLTQFYFAALKDHNSIIVCGE